MAGRIGVAKLNNVTSGTSAKTMIQVVAAANHAIRVIEVGVSFQGTSATAQPILVDLVRQTDAGTATTLTLTKQDDSNGDTLDTTAQHTATAEPTTTDVVRTWSVHPQQGIVYQAPFGYDILVGAGDRIAIRVTAAVAVDVDCYLIFEE